jgi:hypothetical protein
MSLDYKIKKDESRIISVLCLSCSKRIETRQQDKGKAFCRVCDPENVTILCSICDDVVDDEQLENGRCVCGFCDESVYGAMPKQRAKTMKEIVKDSKLEEEKQFVRMMKNLFRRMRV